MVSLPKADRRRHKRFPLSAGVQLYHNPSNRDYPARCVDISDSGLLMYVPVSTPVKPGQPIKLTMGNINSPQFADLSERCMNAKIVRVERHDLIATGQLAVGVEFVRD